MPGLFLTIFTPMPASYSFARILVALFVGVAAILIAGTLLAPALLILDYIDAPEGHGSNNYGILYAAGFLYITLAALAGGYCFRLVIWKTDFPIHLELIVLGLASGASFIILHAFDPSVSILFLILGLPGIRIGSHLCHYYSKRLYKKRGGAAEGE